MKDLIRILLLGGILTALAGPAAAQTYLHCQQAKCAYDEKFGPLQSRTFIGNCEGYPNNGTNTNMVCHAVKGMTCDGAYFDDDKGQWSCDCTNWATKTQNTTMDVYCKGPNE